MQLHAVRRTQKQHEKMKNDILLKKIGNPDFYNEIKKDSYCGESFSSVIDDKPGATEIAQHFKLIYEKLF